MTFDPVRQFIEAKNAFAAERGADPPLGKTHEDSGQPLVAHPKAVPRTTWGDVFLFGSSFRAWADPSPSQCRDLFKANGTSDAEAKVRCQFGGHPHADFVHTKHYKRADALWSEWQPFNILFESRNAFDATVELTAKLKTSAVYPFNEEFWGYGVRYAIARSAAGVVQTRFEIAVESIKESVQELPETVAAPFIAAAEAASNLIPDLSGSIKLLKWTSILGGGALLYWYVLKPKARP